MPHPTHTQRRGSIAVRCSGFAPRHTQVFPPAAVDRTAACYLLELSFGELAAFADRRGTGNPQIDGVRRLLYRHNPHLSGKPAPDLPLQSRLRVAQQPLAEGFVRKALLDDTALHPST